jgi:hypothetical protein
MQFAIKQKCQTWGSHIRSLQTRGVESISIGEEFIKLRSLINQGEDTSIATTLPATHYPATSLASSFASYHNETRHQLKCNPARAFA